MGWKANAQMFESCAWDRTARGSDTFDEANDEYRSQ